MRDISLQCIVDRVHGEWVSGWLHKIETHTWAHAHLLLQYLLGHLGPLGTIKGMQAYTSAHDLFNLRHCFHRPVAIHTASQKLHKNGIRVVYSGQQVVDFTCGLFVVGPQTTTAHTVTDGLRCFCIYRLKCSKSLRGWDGMGLDL